jgi:hypothetical protein
LKRSALSVAWLLLGVLTVAALLITLGKRETEANPRVDSYGPSGLSLFAELLKSNGYSVRSTASSVPNLAKDDVAVICLNETEHSIDRIDAESAGVLRQVHDFAQRGGRVVVLGIAPDFATASREVLEIDAENTISHQKAKAHARINSFPPSEYESYDDEYGPVTAAVWRQPVGSRMILSELARVGKGTALNLRDGYIATNRFIDRAQNSDVVMSSVATIAPKGSHLVFVEAAYRDEEPGLIETLGPGATGMWYQSLFLFVVVVFTLGKRFGLPEEVRPRQSGQRDLVDAMADTYRRARSTRLACRSAYDRADRQVRKALKLSSDAPASERDMRLPQELAGEFRRVFEATIDALSPKEAFARCQALQREVKSFLHR